MMVTLRVVINFEMLINDTFLSIRLCIFNFGHCKLRFSSTTLREWGFDNPCEILQALRQQCCLDACQISERYDYHDFVDRYYQMRS